MPTQLALRFDEVPISCPVQQRYHAIAPCLAGRSSPGEIARQLDVSYATVTRWLREFRDKGLPGLFPATHYPRAPYTPEKIIVTLVAYKCFAPKASARELAQIIQRATGYKLHHETVGELLKRYFFWKYPEFRERLAYPVPLDPLARRLEMVKLHAQGWSEKRIAELLHCSRTTVYKWLRRWQQEQAAGMDESARLFDYSHAPHQPHRKVYFGTIYLVLTLQKKYGYAGWFRLQGYLERDYGIRLSETTIKKIMRLNRRVHLAPQRPVKILVRDPREGPPKSKHPFEHVYTDIRYLDAKPEGIQLYSTLLLEGFSRTILAGSLTPQQDVGVVLHCYYLALLQWGWWNEVISDHGGQFQSHDFARVNQRLGIQHNMYEKGHPWQNLIESQFGIQARVGEYGWERCKSVEAAVEFHRELIRDHNRLPHFAHRFRNDQKHAPLEVLGAVKGQPMEPAVLHRAFSRKFWQRKTDARGFVRVGRWKIYVEEGLPHTPVEISYWEGKLRAEYNTHLLTEYDCRWDHRALRPKEITQPQHFTSPYQSRQQSLFDPLWLREPMENPYDPFHKASKDAPATKQLRFYFGPELVKASG